MTGKVKWFNRGFGFIESDDGTDHFVHYSSLNMDGFKTLSEGDIVDFEIGVGKNDKKQAVNVTPILTQKMVVHELAKEGLHIMRMCDDQEIHGWYVVDQSDKPVVNKEMTLVEAAAYAGIDVEGLTE